MSRGLGDVYKRQDLPRVELFAREKTEGWDAWGNEVESDIEISSDTEKEWR